MTIQISEHFNYRKLIRFTIPTIAMMILGSVGFMIGTGGGALVSKTLGEGREQN